MLLRLEGVDVRYGHVQALWGCSLEVDTGEIVALLGANGAGKTTVLNVVSGIVPASAGRVTLEGRPVSGLRPHEIVGLGVVQVPEGRRIFPAMTVLENLLMGAYHPSRRGGRREMLRRVLEIFPRLAERRGQLAGSLSGGEQQMLAIARALMSRPVLLMLDEPSLGLAPLVADEIFSRIREIRDQGVTVLLVEQDTSQALAVADRGYVLENGRIVLQGRASELLANPRVRGAYLGL